MGIASIAGYSGIYWTNNPRKKPIYWTFIAEKYITTYLICAVIFLCIQKFYNATNNRYMIWIFTSFTSLLLILMLEYDIHKKFI